MNILQRKIVNAVSMLFFDKNGLDQCKYPFRQTIFQEDDDYGESQYLISYLEVDGEDYLELRYEYVHYENSSYNEKIVIIPFKKEEMAWSVGDIADLIELILLHEDPDTMQKLINSCP